MPKTNKFDNQDREKVKSNLPEFLNITTLRMIGDRKTYLKDESGKRYYLCGGFYTWHGVPSEIMDVEIEAQDKTTLLVAMRKNTYIAVYRGAFDKLISGRENLSKDQNGNYKFNVEEDPARKRMIIKEIPNMVLARVGTVWFSLEDKTREKEGYLKKRRIENEIKKMTVEQKTEFIEVLQR